MTNDFTISLIRILWIALFLVGFSFPIFGSLTLWRNWSRNPVLTTVHTSNYPINSHPFPSVTICSVNKISTKDLGYWMANDPKYIHQCESILHFHLTLFWFLRSAYLFKLNEVRRMFQIIATNRVANEDEIIALSELLKMANISSASRDYDKLMQSVNISFFFLFIINSLRVLIYYSCLPIVHR